MVSRIDILTGDTDRMVLIFITSIKPQVDKKKYFEWIHLSRRTDLRIEKIKKHTYMCTKHFINPNVPTIENPNPLSAKQQQFQRSVFFYFMKLCSKHKCINILKFYLNKRIFLFKISNKSV